MIRRPPRSTPFPTRRSSDLLLRATEPPATRNFSSISQIVPARSKLRSEEHTSELQSRLHLVCRLLLEKKKNEPTRSSSLSTVARRTTPPSIQQIICTEYQSR